MPPPLFYAFVHRGGEGAFFWEVCFGDPIVSTPIDGKCEKHKTGLIFLVSMLLYGRFQKRTSFGFLTFKRSA